MFESTLCQDGRRRMIYGVYDMLDAVAYGRGCSTVCAVHVVHFCSLFCDVGVAPLGLCLWELRLCVRAFGSTPLGLCLWVRAFGFAPLGSAWLRISDCAVVLYAVLSGIVDSLQVV